MQDCETINLNEYTLSGEGGTAITYKHNSRNSLAKLYNNGFDADAAIEEFKVAQTVYDLGIPTPKPEESDRFGFASFGGFPLDTETPDPKQHSPAESYALLCDHIRTLAPAITDKQLAKLLG